MSEPEWDNEYITVETGLRARIAELEAERDIARVSLVTCSEGFDAVCKVNSELRAEARAWEKMAREAADRIYELEAKVCPLSGNF